jgi:hypothetical protein
VNQDLAVRTESVATVRTTPVPDQLRQNVLVIFAGGRFDKIRPLQGRGSGTNFRIAWIVFVVVLLVLRMLASIHR